MAKGKLHIQCHNYMIKEKYVKKQLNDEALECCRDALAKKFVWYKPEHMSRHQDFNDVFSENEN